MTPPSPRPVLMTLVPLTGWDKEKHGLSFSLSFSICSLILFSLNPILPPSQIEFGTRHRSVGVPGTPLGPRNSHIWGLRKRGLRNSLLSPRSYRKVWRRSHVHSLSQHRQQILVRFWVLHLNHLDGVLHLDHLDFSSTSLVNLVMRELDTPRPQTLLSKAGLEVAPPHHFRVLMTRSETNVIITESHTEHQ